MRTTAGLGSPDPSNRRLLVAGLLTAASAQGPVESCVTCHTDAAKLKALTPPDPPAAEAGEG